MLVLLTVAVSCKEEDIEVYSGEPRIEFASTEAKCVFDDRAYLEDIAVSPVELKVRSLGHHMEKPLKYFLKEVEESGNVVVNSEYEYVSGNESATAQVTVKRPVSVDRAYYVTVMLDFDNAANGFEAGRTENLECKIFVSYDIEPSDWDKELWGMYSNSKYMFMMDHFKKVYVAIPHTKAARDEVRKAYKEYRKHNPPLMDDEEPQHEISFPED